MAFLLCIGDPDTGKTYRIDLEEEKGSVFVGKKIGDVIRGEVIGISGYQLKITGGRDRDGFSIHPAVHGTGRKRILLAQGPGFKKKERGGRKAKLVRGNVILDDIRQINLKIVERGATPIEDHLSGEEPPE